MGAFFDAMLLVFADWLQMWLALLLVAFIVAALGVIMLTLLQYMLRAWR